jgi:Tol biopolymer transport system component
VLGKALGGFAVLVVFACGAGMAHAAYPGVNGKIVYEHKSGQFATKSSPFALTPGVPGSAAEVARFQEQTYNFVYSPNGKKIAFQAEDVDFPAQIFVMSASGRRPTSVTASARPCLSEKFPTWSPNGKSIAFTCLRKKDLDNEVYSINLDGSGLKKLTSDGDVYQSSWSPLGDKIAYVTFGHAIKTVPSGGGASSPVNNDAPGITGVWGRIDYAPNGLTLAAESTGSGIYTVNVATGVPSANLTPCCAAGMGGIEPAFSPDGTKIAYVSNMGLWTMDATTGANKTAITQNGYDRAPNWQPLSPPG